jgi:hypothetical protein
MLFEKPVTLSADDMLDKFAVKELIEFERYCRDNRLWEQMKRCYSKDSSVTTSWYTGDGQGFVDASSKMQTVAPHKIYSTLVWVKGTKAAAITSACIQSRTEMGGKTLDLSSYVRLVYTAIKETGEWKLASLDAIYEKDCLVPASPHGMEPSGDARASYANVITVIGSEGYDMNPDLAGDDRPDLRDALLAKTKAWFEG